MNKKQYGLILSKKGKIGFIAKKSIFDDGSDEDEHDSKQVERSIIQESKKNLEKRQTQLEMQRAVEADPTVYEYDAIYDDLKKAKEVKKVEKTKDKTPKYIASLMKTAEQRKKDYERREERKIHKEREAEGTEFADKEAFVTSSYKKKMEEMQAEEERERLQGELEARLDVTKQTDLSGFYRHLLNETVGDKNTPPESSTLTTIKKEPEEKNISEEQRQDMALEVIRGRRRSSSQKIEENPKMQFGRDSDSEESGQDESAPSTDCEIKRKRRADSSSDSEEDSKRIKIQKNKLLASSERLDSHLEASKKKMDKDEKSVREHAEKIKSLTKLSNIVKERMSSSESESEDKKSANKKDSDKRKELEDEGRSRSSTPNLNDKNKDEASKPDTEKKAKNKEDPMKRARKLYQKRNVGDVFEAAKQRFLARQAARAL